MALPWMFGCCRGWVPQDMVFGLFLWCLEPFPSEDSGCLLLFESPRSGTCWLLCLLTFFKCVVFVVCGFLEL